MVNSVFRTGKAAALLLNLLQEGKKICIFPFSLENEASSPESQLSICKSTRAKGWENPHGRCSHTVLTPQARL